MKTRKGASSLLSWVNEHSQVKFVGTSSQKDFNVILDNVVESVLACFLNVTDDRTIRSTNGMDKEIRLVY